MRRSLGLALLVLTGGVARAEDAAAPVPRGAPAAGSRLTPPSAVAQAADAVLEAIAANDDRSLKALAANADCDPWLVADELVRRRRVDAAGAFASAAPSEDTATLPAYVAARRTRVDDADLRARLAAARARLVDRDPVAALDVLGPAGTTPPADVVGVESTLARAAALAGAGRSGEAADAYVTAAEASEGFGWLAAAARAWQRASTTAYARTSYALALSASERMLAVAERRRDVAQQAAALQNVGSSRHALGDLEGAVVALERALAGHVAARNGVGAANTHYNLGIVRESLGDLGGAAAAYEKAHETLELLGDRAMGARALFLAAENHLAKGDVAKALVGYERSMAAQEALGAGPRVVESLLGIGSAHLRLGRYAEAIALYERALARAEAIGSPIHVSLALNNLGGVSLALGEDERAVRALERSIAVLTAAGEETHVAVVLGNLAAVWAERGEDARARPLFERQLEAARSTRDRRLEVRATLSLATVHSRTGELELALELAQRALASAEASASRPEIATALEILGEVHRKLGDVASARAAFERAERTARSSRSTPRHVRVLGWLAQLHLDEHAWQKALARAREAVAETESMFRGLGDEEGASARQRLEAVFAMGAFAAAKAEDAAELLTFLESGRAGALLDTLGSREALRWKAETLSPELQLADTRAEAARRRAREALDATLQAGDRRGVAAATRALDDADADARAVFARIQRETKRAAGLFYPRASTLEDVQASLEDGEALVLYGMCLDEALALVVRPGRAAIVPLGKRVDVEAACKALDGSDVASDPTAALASLRRRVVEPLGLGPDVRRVIVSPEGPLGYAPFGALFDVPVAVTPSGTTHVLLRDDDRERGVGVLALGAPDYGGVALGARATFYRGRPLSPLPATEAEAVRIGTTTLLGGRASEEGLRAALAGHGRWRAVHFACHGLVDGERPMLSSLALSRGGDEDGFLTAAEILRMRIPAELAVLSACETAKGKVVRGEGIVGLTRAFMYAGSSRVICSLWKVDDEATQALMTRFYELWSPRDGKPGLPTAQALREAQAFVRSQAKWKHPYYWAAWVVWGLPS